MSGHVYRISLHMKTEKRAVYVHARSDIVNPFPLQRGADKNHNLSCGLIVSNFLTPGMTMRSWRSSARHLPRTCWLRLETLESSKWFSTTHPAKIMLTREAYWRSAWISVDLSSPSNTTKKRLDGQESLTFGSVDANWFAILRKLFDVLLDHLIQFNSTD